MVCFITARMFDLYEVKFNPISFFDELGLHLGLELVLNPLDLSGEFHEGYAALGYSNEIDRRALKTVAILSRRFREGMRVLLADSNRAMTDWLDPIFFANAAWVSPAFSRAVRMSCAMLLTALARSK